MTLHHLSVTKTARYYTLGTLNEQTEEIWFVIHGYAQLASVFLQDFEALDNGKRFFIAPEGLSRFYVKGGWSEVAASWMTKEDRDYEIKDYIAYLNKLYDAIVPADTGAKICALGFSQGTAAVSRWVYLNERKVDKLIFYAGEIGAELQHTEASALFDQPEKYFICGLQDQFIKPAHLDLIRTILPNFKLITFEGRHEINIDAIRQTL